jgi:hypothetical protein
MELVYGGSLRSPVISLLYHPQNPLLNHNNLCCFLTVRDKASHPYVYM